MGASQLTWPADPTRRPRPTEFHEDWTGMAAKELRLSGPERTLDEAEHMGDQQLYA